MSSLFKRQKYKEDLTGRSRDNLITDERHVVAPTYNVIVPGHAPFFRDSMVVLFNTKELVSGKDYVFSDLDEEATKRAGQPVYNLIVLKDNTINGEVWLNYQTFGLTDYASVITKYIETLMLDDRKVDWSDVSNLPDGFKPYYHKHHVDDLVGIWPVVNELQQIRQAIEYVRFVGNKKTYDLIQREVLALHTRIDYVQANVGNGTNGGGVSSTEIQKIISKEVRTAIANTAKLVDWANITNKPETFVGDWNTLINRPTSLPVTWDEVKGKPLNFPVAWGSIQNKPQQFETRWDLIDEIPRTFPTTWEQVAGKPTNISTSWPAVTDKPKLLHGQLFTVRRDVGGEIPEDQTTVSKILKRYFSGETIDGSVSIVVTFGSEEERLEFGYPNDVTGETLLTLMNIETANGSAKRVRLEDIGTGQVWFALVTDSDFALTPWKSFVPSIDYSQLKNMPDITFDWDDVKQKPSLFDTNWGKVQDKPETFPATWDEIRDKPASYPTRWDDVADRPTVIDTWGALKEKPEDFPTTWSLVKEKPEVVESLIATIGGYNQGNVLVEGNDTIVNTLRRAIIHDGNQYRSGSVLINYVFQTAEEKENYGIPEEVEGRMLVKVFSMKTDAVTVFELVLTDLATGKMWTQINSETLYGINQSRWHLIGQNSEVTWDSLKGKPESFRSEWSKISGIPTFMSTRWDMVEDRPPMKVAEMVIADEFAQTYPSLQDLLDRYFEEGENNYLYDNTFLFFTKPGEPDDPKLSTTGWGSQAAQIRFPLRVTLAPFGAYVNVSFDWNGGADFTEITFDFDDGGFVQGRTYKEGFRATVPPAPVPPPGVSP